MVGIVKHLFIMSMVLCSAIGLILCQYSMDSLFKWANGGQVYAIQLMPEAKLLTDSRVGDHQSFAGSYFSFSVGLGIAMTFAIVYAILFRSSTKQGGRLNGLKCLIIISFMIIATMSFLKPYLHMTKEGGSFSIDQDQLSAKFLELD